MPARDFDDQKPPKRRIERGRYKVTVEDADGYRETWLTHDVPYAVGDFVFLEGRETMIIVHRAWTSSLELTLRIKPAPIIR
jgi:hypothetical protein